MKVLRVLAMKAFSQALASSSDAARLQCVMPIRTQEQLFATSAEPSPARPKPAPKRALIAHIDGGARGNPGPAGYGVFIEDEAGKVVAELYKYLGRQTNNFAEYSALVAALEYAKQHECKALAIFSDSELLVKQIKGVYKVRNEGLIPLFERAKSVIRTLDSFRVTHVRREQNKDADRLANKAMDEGMRR
jgi:ribonuclease HI